MSSRKGDSVLVEINNFKFIWTCPSCKNENDDLIEISLDHFTGRQCAHCDVVVKKEGEISWVIE